MLRNSCVSSNCRMSWIRLTAALQEAYETKTLTTLYLPNAECWNPAGNYKRIAKEEISAF